MSSKRDSWRAVLAFLDRNPKLESIIEILLSTFFTFVPIAVASLLAMSRDKDFVWSKFTSLFGSYFTAGELILVVLSLCGSVIWIYAVKAKNAGLFERFLFVLVMLCIVFLFGGGVLGNNPGFGTEYPSWVLRLIALLYVVSLGFWLFASISAKSDSATEAPVDDAARADELLRRANQRGGQ